MVALSRATTVNGPPCTCIGCTKLLLLPMKRILVAALRHPLTRQPLLIECCVATVQLRCGDVEDAGIANDSPALNTMNTALTQNKRVGEHAVQCAGRR